MSIHKGVEVSFIEGDPPGSASTQRSVYARIRVALRENPGRWAALYRFPTEQREKARNVRVSLVYKQPDLEAVLRVVDGEIVIHARAVAS